MRVKITVLFGMFCAAMEALITATILPTIISSLGGLDLYPWIVNSFLLSVIVVAPIFGRMSDIYGYKRVYLVAVCIFLVSSALCGMAQNMVQLIVFRGLQGVGTGGLIAMSVIFFGEISTLKERPKMQAMLATMWAIASLLGPAFGAFLAQSLSWRWAFYINVPAGLAIIASISFFVKKPTSKKAHDPLDKTALLLFFMGCLSLVYGLVAISQLRLNYFVFFSLFIGLGLIYVFIRRSIGSSSSFIPISLFANPEVIYYVMLGFMTGFFLFCVANFLPIYVQGVLGKSAGYAGRVVTAMAMGSFAGALAFGGLVNRLGFRKMALIGAVLLILGFSFFAYISYNPNVLKLAICAFLIGAGNAAISNVGIVGAQAASPKKMIGRATSLVHFFRSSGGLIGMSMMGGLQLGIFRRGLESLSEKESKYTTLLSFLESPQQIFDSAHKALWPPDLTAKLTDLLGFSIEVVFYLFLVFAIIALIISLKVSTKKPVDYSLIEDPILLEE